MGFLAFQVDLIVHRTLTSMLPLNLSFVRDESPPIVTYTLLLDKITVGSIQIEIISSPDPSVLLTFTTIPVSVRLSKKLTRINQKIIKTVESATSPHRWQEITPDQQPIIKSFGDLPSIPDHAQQPWELIPDHYWDRIAVKLWCDGYTNREIAQRVNVHPRSVTNRISALRKRYPQAHIPTHEERLKLMIRDDTG